MPLSGGGPGRRWVFSHHNRPHKGDVPMKPFPGLVLSGALLALLSAADTASAAWNNVFQVTFFHRKPVQSQYFAVPVPAPVAVAPTQAFSSPCCDPCQKCTTAYVQ